MIDLLELYKRPAINYISGFCEEIHQLKSIGLVAAYFRANDSAPGRHLRNKRYFVGHILPAQWRISGR